MQMREITASAHIEHLAGRPLHKPARSGAARGRRALVLATSALLAGCVSTGGNLAGSLLRPGDGGGEAQGYSTTTGKTYAATESQGAVSLEAIRANKAPIAPLAVAFRAHRPEDLAGRRRIAVPNYGLGFVVTGDVRASSSGFGSAMIQRAAKFQTALAGIDEALMKTLADEAHADLLQRLGKAGIDAVPDAELKSHPDMATLGHAPGNRNQGKGIIDGRATKGWVVFGAAAAPLGEGMNIGGYPRQQGALQNIGVDLDAVMLHPVLVVDYIALESSGNSIFGGKASASAGLWFSVHGASNVMFGYKTKRMPGTGYGGSLNANPTGSPEPFAVLRQVDDKSDNVAVQNGFALLGLGSLFRSSKVLVAEAVAERYADLVRAAYRGYNQAIVDAIVAARKGA